jgi:hypothetical protein
MQMRAKRIFSIIIFGLLFSCLAMGQTDSVARTSADENFRLNISESRVSESNYERSTSVEVSSNNRQNAVFVRVGATATAEKIAIVLRGVKGDVRFRASLDALRRRIVRPAEPAVKSDNR